MRKREGERIIGRFIKASDIKVLDKVKMTDFSFEEICSTPVASLDNIRSNIMRPDLHSVDEIHSVVREHDSLDLELRSKETIRPPMQPIDFTHEWNRIKERVHQKREMKMEDDDDLEFEMALQSEQVPTQEESSEEPVDAKAEETESEVEENQMFKIKKEDEGVEDSQQAEISDEAMNILSGTSDESTNELASEFKRVEETEDVESAPDPAGSFIPVNPEASFEAGEKEASEAYKEQVDIEKMYAEELEVALNEARAKGYEEGFVHGEEKASIQVQQNATEVVNNLGQVVSELEHLKKTILDNTQENFYEISQAVAESLLRREFSINPGSMADVLRKAIDDLVADDEIKIAVHPETFGKLMAIEIDDLKDKMIKDDNIPVGDFRIDSNLSVVDGNVKELIRELLEQADLDIISDEDKEEEKVG